MFKARTVVLRIFFDTARQQQDRIYLDELKANPKLVGCFFRLTDQTKDLNAVSKSLLALLTISDKALF
jgi:hypothetical protein